MEPVWKKLGARTKKEGLHIATAKSRIADMKALIEDGVDINAKVSTLMSASVRVTPLHLAAHNGLLKSAEFLISAGADLDLRDEMDLTPLMNACANGKRKGSRMAMLLIEAGADVTAVREDDGMTALKFAVKECEPEVIETLIESGAEVDGPKDTHQTALMLAARANNVEALEILIRHGADPNYPCGLHWAKGKTAAWLAEEEGCDDAYEFLKDL